METESPTPLHVPRLRFRNKHLKRKSHARHVVVCVAAFFLMTSACCAAEGPAAESQPKSWTITPRSIESPLLQYRLMPAEYEPAQEGKCTAPILLRMPWEQLPYFTQVWFRSFPIRWRSRLRKWIRFAKRGGSFRRGYTPKCTPGPRIAGAAGVGISGG